MIPNSRDMGLIDDQIQYQCHGNVIIDMYLLRKIRLKRI